jgi:hypothetical protein
MHWVLQDNLHNEVAYKQLTDILTRLSITFDVVKVIPFTSGLPIDQRIEPVIQPEGSVMVCGSTTLSDVALQAKWHPGSFLNDNHDFQIWSKYYGYHSLNSHATVSRFADVSSTYNQMFIRPCLDSKTFAGQVLYYDEFKDWQHRVLDLYETYTSLNADTMVLYGPVYKLQKEIRFFIVDNKIATASQYKLGNKVIYSNDVDPDAYEFVKKMVKLYSPAKAFVLDICLTNDEYKVVEINCINSAGFYAADVQKLVMALEDMTL